MKKNLDSKSRTGAGASALRMAALVTAALLLAMGCAARSAAQAVPAGDEGGLSVAVGGTFNGYSLQYGQEKRLGPGVFVDVETKRRLGLEVEARWLDMHETVGAHATNYLAGLRYRVNVGKFQPYAKLMGGYAEYWFPYDYAYGRYLVYAPGAGIDYKLSRRVSIRVADFEYQVWPQFTFGSMTALSGSAGIRVKVF